MQKIMSSIWCQNNAQEMADFYTAAIPGVKQGKKSYYGDFAPRVGQQIGALMTLDLKVQDYEFMMLNAGDSITPNPSISHYIVCKSAEEVDSIYAKLSKGGKDLMPLDKYPFSERYAWTEDKFGLSWQIILVDMAQKVVPCMMFVGQQHGRAQEAITFYTSIFENSSQDFLVTYPAESGEAPNTVMHASFTIDGQKFIAMDSGHQHAFNFNEGVSIVVNCKNQKEVDYLWEKLSEDGGASQCGWLKDKFGIFWQIVPESVRKLQHKDNQARTDNMMKALMTMRKLDEAALIAAYEE
ncbi:MAG: VOC family protein [Candidatus Obscuribacterales bacterium]|jgi:predicted 3-demethylubiquinone-9 3-methyltransferase (glyoxalase superfamily)